MARPRIYDADVIADKLAEYTANTEEPLIQEFCVRENISDETLRRLRAENTALDGAIKNAIKKQEVALLRNGSTGKINPVFAIFRLKQPQFGYTDRADLAITAQAAPPDPAQLQAQLKKLLAGLTEEEKRLLNP